MDTPTHFHFCHRRAVEFADTDLAGIMHFANFFRFVESAEHAFFRSLGFRVHQSDGRLQDGWPRLEVSCHYRKPARFEQMLEICLRIDEVRTSSLRYSFWIFAEADPSRAVIAHGTFGIVHVELDTAAHQIRKTPVHDDLRAKLAAVMAAPAPLSAS